MIINWLLENVPNMYVSKLVLIDDFHTYCVLRSKFYSNEI